MEKKYQCVNVVASGHTAVNLSRHNLLQWIDDELGVKLRKIEALCSGAVYCQFMNMLFPGCIQMKKIKLDATVKNEYWSNFKQLQMAFRAVGCEKGVPIDKIIEGRFQENFEFLQWFKRFYDINREQSSLTSASPKQGKKTPSQKSYSQPSTSRLQDRPVAVVNPVSNQTLMEKELESQIVEYESRAEKLIQEKDFFYTKLRNIELLCTQPDVSSTNKKRLISKIFKELYATGESVDSTDGEKE